MLEDKKSGFRVDFFSEDFELRERVKESVDEKDDEDEKKSPKKS